MKKRLSLVALAILFFACAKDLVTGKSSYNFFKVEDDVKLGKQVMAAQLQELEKEKKPVDKAADPKELARIQKIVNRIVAVSHYPTFPYEVHLADLPVVNAWCAPGGKIMVYSGLWDPEKGLVTKGSDAELAAVLAHEIAHATARHVTESLSRNISLSVVGQAALSAISTQSAAGADLFEQTFSQGMNLYIPSYSRKNESEADRIGLTYMAKAGYDPRAAVVLWERASKKRGDKTSVYASHPASGERAKKLKALLPPALELYEKSPHRQ